MVATHLVIPSRVEGSLLQAGVLTCHSPDASTPPGMPGCMMRLWTK
jgi:hypothetical protein